MRSTRLVAVLVGGVLQLEGVTLVVGVCEASSDGLAGAGVGAAAHLLQDAILLGTGAIRRLKANTTSDQNTSFK